MTATFSGRASSRLRSRSLVGMIVVVFCAAPAAAAAVEIKLTNAWMRPAYAGQPAHDAYVDVTSDAPVRLTKVSTPAAKAVDIVVLEKKDADGSAKEKVVRSLDIPAGTPTRFALYGNVLRLVAVRQALDPTQTVPLTLEFADSRGRKVTARTDALVRGLFPRRPPDAKPAASPSTPPTSTQDPASPPASMR